MALNKRSYQSSTYTDQFGTHGASLANDGSRQTNYETVLNGCVRSRSETNPWWAVDLYVETLVAQVNLTNRGDAHGIDLNYLSLINFSALDELTFTYSAQECCMYSCNQGRIKISWCPKHLTVPPPPSGEGSGEGRLVPSQNGGLGLCRQQISQKSTVF